MKSNRRAGCFRVRKPTPRVKRELTRDLDTSSLDTERAGAGPEPRGTRRAVDRPRLALRGFGDSRLAADVLPGLTIAWDVTG